MPGVDRRLALKLIIVRRLRKRLKRKTRETSIRPIFFNRINQGESLLVKELSDDPHYHFRYFRMNKINFDEIFQLVGPEIIRQNTHSRPIGPLEKLALTLRYLASGNSQISLAMSYRFSPSSVCNILRETLAAICSKLGPIHLRKPTAETWKTNEEGFNKTWNHPNCIGALDGKHVRVKAPPGSGSAFYNYKGYFSIVLLALVDPNYKFNVVDIGASGSQSDGGVLARSALGRKLEDGSLNLPESKLVGNKLLPHVIVADDAFPLKTCIMKPFSGKFLEVKKRIYNYRMSRARMVVENGFGVLAARWRIFHTIIHADQDLALLIVESCVILHNFLLSKRDMNNITTDSIIDGRVAEGNWHEIVQDDSGFQNIQRQGSTNTTVSAKNIRESFMEYFSSEEGSVAWQNECI